MNYKELLEKYNEVSGNNEEVVRGGRNKNLQFNRILQYFEVEKLGTGKGTTYNIIRELTKDEIETAKVRRRLKQFDNYLIDARYNNTMLVYCIATDNKIYVGSSSEPYNRFKRHNVLDDNQKHTKELLDEGGLFQVLYLDERIQDIELIREIEQIYIEYFYVNGDWELINKRKAIADNEPVNRIIRVSNDNYDKAIKMLKENGLI